MPDQVGIAREALRQIRDRVSSMQECIDLARTALEEMDAADQEPDDRE